MNSQTIIYSSIYLILLFIAVPFTAMAQDITLLPSIDIRAEYDDNVGYSRISKTSDYLTRINPAFTLDYATELLDLKSSVDVGILRYKDETELDTEDQHYGIKGVFQFLEKVSVSGNCSYAKDTTLESELQETGLIDNTRQDRKRYMGGMGFSYQISEVSQVGVNYSHTKTDYDWAGNVDYTADSISFSFNHRLGNQLDLITIQPYYSWYDSETSKTDNYGLSFGWAHPFSETLTLSAFIGARYTKTKYSRLTLRHDFSDFIRISEYYWWNPSTGEVIGYEDLFIGADEKASSQGGVADINLKKTGETYSAEIGYSQNLGYSSYGEPIQTYSLYCNADRRITERLGIGFSGNVHLTKSEGEFNDRDNRYYSITPRINYKIAENYSLTMAYSYSQSYNKLASSYPKAERNRVWLALDFRFPRKW